MIAASREIIRDLARVDEKRPGLSSLVFQWALQDLNLSSGPLIGVGQMVLLCCNPLPALSFRTVRR